MSELGTQAVKAKIEWRLVPRMISFIVVRKLQFVRMKYDFNVILCVPTMTWSRQNAYALLRIITMYLLGRPQSLLTHEAAHNEAMSDKY